LLGFGQSKFKEERGIKNGETEENDKKKSERFSKKIYNEYNC